MTVVGHDVVIEITGTKKSRILDPQEIQKVEFSRHEKLREDFEGINDLLDHILGTAYLSGDAIFRLTVDGEDIVRSTIERILRENSLDLNESLAQICELPFLSNADPADVYELMQEIAPG